MPVQSQSKAPTRAELEKVFGRPLTDAEYRGMLNISPAPAVARPLPEQEGVKSGGVAYQFADGVPHTAIHDAIDTRPVAEPVKPLFGLPSKATPEADAKAALPYWYADSVGGNAAGDVATAPEYLQMVQASKAKPVAPVATMPQESAAPVVAAPVIAPVVAQSPPAAGAALIQQPTVAVLGDTLPAKPKKEKK